MLSSDAIHQMSGSQLRDLAHRLMQQLADQSKRLDQFSSDIAQRDQALRSSTLVGEKGVFWAAFWHRGLEKSIA